VTQAAAGKDRPATPVPASVGYSGEPGAFAEDAVVAAFGQIERAGLPGFRQVFEDTASGGLLAGIVPIENSVNGTVRENYDLLLEHDLEIRAEVVVPVRLCLAAMPGERIEGIERVYSHIQALGQAEAFLRGRPWTLMTTYNTAGAGKLIADAREPGSGAVLSPRAAALFGLDVLADEIQDVADNRTRFLVLTRPGAPTPSLQWRPHGGGQHGAGMRTTLAVAVRNEPGALLRVLQVFADHGLNMSTLESRPSRERAWEYVFWVDLDADIEAQATRAAVTDLVPVTTFLRVLGSYPRWSDR
jgi:prephenate dehydratase